MQNCGNSKCDDWFLGFIEEGGMNRWSTEDFCCCCSVAKLCQSLCDPMDCRAPGYPILHYVVEFD